MKISLESETVVVTGGAKRLGRAIVLELAAAGASVAFTYNTSHEEASTLLAQLREDFPAQQFAALGCDLANPQELAALPGRVLDAVGMPTALVNNAAIFRRTPFEETSTPDWEHAFDEHINANLKAPYLLCKYFGDLFLQRERGAIVNLADIYGQKPLKNYAPYCLSKAGVVMLTQVLALALAPYVRVNAIAPGTILVPSETQNEDDDVELLRKKIPLGRLGMPQEIAQAICFLIGGPNFISGTILPIDGAQHLK